MNIKKNIKLSSRQISMNSFHYHVIEETKLYYSSVCDSGNRNHGIIQVVLLGGKWQVVT